jgi:ABC-type polysaccharide/polyol phosphate export permease
MAEKVLQHNQRTPDRLFTTLIGLVAATMFLAAIVVRMKIVQPAVDLLQTNPDDRQSVVRWRSGSIISFVLAETVILFGLAMRVSGLGRNQTIPFYVAAVVLMIFLRPRRQ